MNEGMDRKVYNEHKLVVEATLPNKYRLTDQEETKRFNELVKRSKASMARYIILLELNIKSMSGLIDEQIEELSKLKTED